METTICVLYTCCTASPQTEIEACMVKLQIVNLNQLFASKHMLFYLCNTANWKRNGNSANLSSVADVVGMREDKWKSFLLKQDAGLDQTRLKAKASQRPKRDQNNKCIIYIYWQVQEWSAGQDIRRTSVSVSNHFLNLTVAER